MPFAKRKQVKEAKAPYRVKRAPSTAKPALEGVVVRWAEIENAAKPIVLERDGEPVAVVVKYDEYQRLENVRKEQATVPMAEIQRIVDIIAEKFNPDRIILFGSYAYGLPRRGSDVDLLVVIDFEGSPIEKAIEVTGILGGRSFGLDLLVRTSTEIERRLGIGDRFIREIMTLGKVLYARDNRSLAGKS